MQDPLVLDKPQLDIHPEDHDDSQLTVARGNHHRVRMNNQAESRVSPQPKTSENRRIRHLMVIHDGDNRKEVELTEASYFIGRDPKNTIVLKSRDISRQHAIFLRITGNSPDKYHYILVDGNLKGKGSVNGTKVNEDSCLSTRLNHGDRIEFGCQVYANYLVLCPLTDDEFRSYCEDQDYEELLAEPPDNPNTLLLHPPDQRQQETASLVRLASFPEILPCPMFEIDLEGRLTYLNPAAMKAFPTLPALGLQHPTLKGLLVLVGQSNQKVLRREVAVGQQAYEQAIQFIAENGLVRSCLFEITQRKYAESELLKRDRLLQSVALANSHLLSHGGIDEAINPAIAAFGEASGMVQIEIFEQPLADSSQLSSRYQWLNPARQRPLSRASTASLPADWAEQLQAGKMVRSHHDLDANPDPDAATVEEIALPIFLNDQYWGFMAMDFGHAEPDWSAQEESIIWTLVNSISSTLQRHHQEEVIKRQAYYDALTGLPNRILFADRLSLSLAAARRNSQSVAVMFMDLDRFKSINDTLGHSAGDALLQEVARRVQACLRESDTIARWGGDEFTVLLPQIKRVECATVTAQRILDAFSEGIVLDGQEIFTNTSIGIAFYPADGKEPETLLKNADVALYQAKERGRGIYQLYNRAINSEVSEQFELRNHLRHACDRNEMTLFYQPQLDLKTGQMTGVEALLRWRHPQKGMVSPASFIPLAEETGLIIEIGAWVLRTACQQGVIWHGSGLSSLRVSVNLSARQFFDPNLVNTIRDILDETQFNPAYLDLEITETTAIKNTEYTKSVVQQLQEMGIQIAMDDFGTGFSSLNYLTQLPFDVLKVDQCFIQNLQLNAKEFQIIQAIIALAIGLDLTVVAEGVDSQEQLDLLRMLNCPFVQGYFICHPMGVQEITEILLQNLAHKSIRPL